MLIVYVKQLPSLSHQVTFQTSTICIAITDCLQNTVRLRLKELQMPRGSLSTMDHPGHGKGPPGQFQGEGEFLPLKSKSKSKRWRWRSSSQSEDPSPTDASGENLSSFIRFSCTQTLLFPLPLSFSRVSLLAFSILNFNFSAGIRTPITEFESRNSASEPQWIGDFKSATA